MRSPHAHVNIPATLPNLAGLHKRHWDGPHDRPSEMVCQGLTPALKTVCSTCSLNARFITQQKFNFLYSALLSHATCKCSTHPGTEKKRHTWLSIPLSCSSRRPLAKPVPAHTL